MKLTDLRVLFVDDDEGVGSVLATYCEVLQIDHAVVNSPHDAIDYCRQYPVALVVTDLAMPEMNGLELAEHLRQEHPDLTFFAFTAHDSHYLSKRFTESFDKIFFKPNEYSHMIGEVMKALAIKQYPFLA